MSFSLMPVGKPGQFTVNSANPRISLKSTVKGGGYDTQPIIPKQISGELMDSFHIFGWIESELTRSFTVVFKVEHISESETLEEQ